MCSGRVVACNTRGTHLESSKRPIFIVKIFPVNCLKDKNKEKEAGNGHFKKIGDFSHYLLIEESPKDR